MKNLLITCICALLAFPAGAATRRVAAGDDLGRAIRTLKDNDTLVIAAGSYAVEGTLAVKRSTVIAGEAGARPRITVGSFRIGTGAEHLVLRGLDLTLGGKHLVDTPSEGSVEIGLIAIENCTVDLGGSTGAGLVGSRTSGTARNRIGEIRVEDCMVFNGGFPQHFVYSAASTSQTAVGKIRLCDSTFADMARGAVVTNARMQTRVEIERCTFYGHQPRGQQRRNHPAGQRRSGHPRHGIGLHLRRSRQPLHRRWSRQQSRRGRLLCHGRTGLDTRRTRTEDAPGKSRRSLRGSGSQPACGRRLAAPQGKQYVRSEDRRPEME